jgi:hypothetical protein
VIGVEAVGQPDRPLQQDGLYARLVQDANGGRKLGAKRAVALQIRGVDRPKVRAKLRAWPDQIQVPHGRGQCRQHKLGAGMADDPLPVGAPGVHHGQEFVGGCAARNRSARTRAIKSKEKTRREIIPRNPR